MDKVCKYCINYTPEPLQESFPHYQGQGYCDLFGDANDFEGKVAPRNDVCYGEDYESYSAGVIVMEQFGCIHWRDK